MMATSTDDEDPILRERPQLRAANLSPLQRTSIICDVKYWIDLCPWLHVGDKDSRACFGPANLTPSADLVDECRDHMAHDGYWTITSDVLDDDTGEKHLAWAVDIAGLAKAVETLVEHGWVSQLVSTCQPLGHPFPASLLICCFACSPGARSVDIALRSHPTFC